MSYVPDYKVLAWPADDHSGPGTEIVILSGDITFDKNELIAEFAFDIPVAVDDVPDDWDDFDVEYLQRGTQIDVLLSENGFATAGTTKFSGSIVDVKMTRDEKPARISVICQCPMAPARAQGVNLSIATKMLIYETTWDWDQVSPPNGWADNGTPEGDDFIVNIPDNGEEWVPKGVITLIAYKTDGSEVTPHEYEPNEYVYSAGLKQLIFKESQGAPDGLKVDPGLYQWRIRLYYYDSTDINSTVKVALTTIMTGDPYGDDGGMGIAPGDLDLKPVMSFNASGITSDAYGYWYTVGDEKLVGILTREKVDGPISQLFEDMRDAGLLPLNYRIWFDPVARKFRGRYLFQDSGTTREPAYDVISDDKDVTAEGMAGICEVYAEAFTLEDLGVDAVITFNTPLLNDNPGTPYVFQHVDFGVVHNLVDGRPDTIFQHSYTASGNADQKPQDTPCDWLVFDLGSLMKVRRIQLTTCVPQSAPGDAWDRYYVSWLPKVTISGSPDPITPTNPGIPVSADAINQQMDPNNSGANNGIDIDVTCDWIWMMRYIAIRFEQDLFERTASSLLAIYRSSQFGLSAVKILGDGYIRYISGDDEGRVPYAIVTDKGGTATAVNPGAKTVTIPLAEAARFDIGDRIALWDTSAALPFGASGALWIDTIANINYGTGLITLTNIFPTEDIDGTPAIVGIGDKIGFRKRWMLDLAANWQDFYYPRLKVKIDQTYKWSEILQTDEPGDPSEAEGMAVERLLELISIYHDYNYLTPLDLTFGIGTTTRIQLETEIWLVERIIYHLNPSSNSIEARVQMTVSGSDYEQVLA